MKECIQKCVTCQTVKPVNEYNLAELKPLTPSKPFELITTDILGPLTVTPNKNQYILVVCDHFTKFVQIFPLQTQTADEVAKKLLSFICLHGIPDGILTDQGANFQSELLIELCDLLDIHKLRTSPYHPECDGLSERFNRTLVSMVKAFTNDKMDNWDKPLEILAFAYNTATHSTTRCTPFELVYARKPKVPIDLCLGGVPVELALTPEQYAASIQKV